MSKNKKYLTVKEYLIVKCRPLNDQWECDYDRTPICITNDYSKYNADDYEIYVVFQDGRIKLFKECNY